MIFIIIYCLSFIGCVYFMYRAYILAGLFVDQVEYTKKVEELNQFMYDHIQEAYKVMKDVDNKQIFEKDDDVGTTFEQLNLIVTNLKEEFDTDAEEEKK